MTDFKTFIESPYRWVLERHLKLADVDDADRELDNRVFGTLAHAVLEEFGKGPWQASNDEGAIRKALYGALEDAVRKGFGSDVLPAVRLQVEQLRYRLGLFATCQAAWVDSAGRSKRSSGSPRSR